MKASQALQILGVCRQSLSRYVQQGKIKCTILPNGRYDYDDESVYKLYDKELVRHNALYCRVSTNKQKQDLLNQEQTLKDYCAVKGVIVDRIYKDIGSGINFERKGFQELLYDVINMKVSTVYVTYKDRLSRISFSLFKGLFQYYNCEIIVLNDTDDEKLIEKEIFKEIIDLIHCFSMKVYSSRRKEKLKLVGRDLELEEEVKNIENNSLELF